MRNYNLLWAIWAAWALLVIFYLIDGYARLPLIFYCKLTVALFGAGGVGCLVFLYGIRGKDTMFSFDKNKKTALDAPLERNETERPNERSNRVGAVQTRKDTFIAPGTRFTGRITADAHLTIEGAIDGDVLCENSINVEHSGTVKGEIRAQQVVVDGYVEGRVYAGVIAILAQGTVVGDIFANELSIEKGGVFTGQSNPLGSEEPAYADQASLPCESAASLTSSSESR